ncbi:sugar-binding transcriptional regulator [Microbacterium marinilacus]|uniref:Sugar-binding transcriptional regulator n=1 Tax=Microbacterium marinilacus TaxID=415209 RepID=A0ABP7B4T1_9MICO|nr:sugar-binding domain-containing protein [Microbacterium marinilacus]MBY0687950.1 sugar-binding transcriptional regulator [Microbacterium marinilacus]
MSDSSDAGRRRIPGDRRADAARLAAQLYYLQDMTMASIADEMALSRSSVSRLLGYARETGIVDIRISESSANDGALEQEIRDRYHVTAHVVPMPGAVSEIDRLDRVAMTAARLLTQFVESNMMIGVAWGSTLGAVSRHLPTKELHGVTVVQLNGAGNMQTTGIEYASEILQRFGQAFSARVQQFPVPAFFDDPATREAMWRERSTRRVLEMQARMDLAVFGMGSPTADVPSRVYAGGYLDRADFRSLAEDHAVGDVATVFFRADGTWRDIRLNARTTGPGLDRLRRVPRRVGVAAGAHKVAALRAAMVGRLVTDVVVDDTLAWRLMTS